MRKSIYFIGLVLIFLFTASNGKSSEQSQTGFSHYHDKDYDLESRIKFSSTEITNDFTEELPEETFTLKNGVNWICFPVDYPGLYAIDQIEETQCYFNYLYCLPNGSLQLNSWAYLDCLDLLYTQGYKLDLCGIREPELQYTLKGDHVREDQVIPLDPQQNRFWIPYFMHGRAKVETAFSDIMDYALQIKSQYWMMYRKSTDSEWQKAGYSATVDLVCNYGSMYDVILEPGHPEMMDYYGLVPQDGLKDYLPPETEYYKCREKLDYKAVLIDTIICKEPVKEIAVFNGEKCIGTSVFEGYPVFIRVFKDVFHRVDEQAEFRIYTNCGSEEKVVYNVYDEDHAIFKDRILNLYNNGITRLCLAENKEELPFMLEKKVNVKINIDLINYETAIEYSIPEAGNVNIAIYNIKGQKVKSLISSEQAAGLHKVIWNGTDDSGKSSASGIYFYVLKYNDQIIRDKMLMIK